MTWHRSIPTGLAPLPPPGAPSPRARFRVRSRRGGVAEALLRATLNDLAQIAPDWLGAIAAPEWYERYGRRVEQSRLPKSEAARPDLAQQGGHDGAVGAGA